MQEFDMNVFKREMKKWVRDNPVRSNEEFRYFCAMRIPTEMEWVLNESLAWYKNIRLLKPRYSDGKFSAGTS